MSLKYLFTLVLLAPRYARQSQKQGDKRSLLAISIDIVFCYVKYKVMGHTYLNKNIGTLSDEKRCELIEQLSNKAEYYKKYFENWRFLNKYSGFEWQKSRKKIKKRAKAYIKQYHMGKHCTFQYGVMFIFEHLHVGKLSIGDHIFFARNVDIDITGDLSIGDGVKISENVKILTHNHELDYTQIESDYGLIETPLVIKDNVGIGARAVIMPGVSEIGRRAFIATGAVVKKQVPPYAIIMGNPARVVGFRYTPEQILEFEEDEYPVEERLPDNVLEANYKKYYLDKLQGIKHFLDYNSDVL